MLRPPPSLAPQAGSTAIGVTLVAIGSLAIGMAAWQHRRFARSLNPGDLPRYYLRGWSSGFASAISVIGFTLAAFLLAAGCWTHPVGEGCGRPTGGGSLQWPGGALDSA